MSKIFDNIETKFEEGLHAISESGDRTWLFTVGNMSLMELCGTQGRQMV